MEEGMVSALILAVVLLLLALFWILQFAQLMALADDDFPGRHDKLLWVVAFILGHVLAAVAFVWWRRIMLAARAIEREQRSKAVGRKQ